MSNFVDNNARRKLDRPITGIIQKDKIWEQWYSQETMNSQLPKMSQEDFLFQCVGDEPDRIILNYKGRKTFTVSEFKKYVEKFKKSFAMINYKVGDVICTIGLTTPELYAIKYAATSLGMITCNLNILDVAKIDDEGINNLYKKINMIQPKALFVADYLEDKVFSTVNSKEFSDILKIRMPIDYSMSNIDIEKRILELRQLKFILSGKTIDNVLSLREFLKIGDLCKGYDSVYKNGLPCNISFTSGTIGENKAVLISHDANNATAYQQKIADFGYKVGTKNLALLPPFLAFWDADVVHTVLCLGGQNIMDLTVDPEKVKYYFKKYDINMGIWPQYIWNESIKDPKVVKRMSQSLRQAIIGGERCEVNAAESFYNMTGVQQLTGYGASEVNTTFSVCHPKCNKIGSAGLPLPFNNLKIVDASLNDLTYGKPGKLLIQSPALMNGYYKNKKATEQSFYIDKNGEKWYITGDYAVIDDDGCLTVLDRYKDPVIINSKKIQLLDEVEKIKKDRNIRICKLNYIDNKIILNIVLDSFLGLSQEEAVNSIKNTIKSNLEEELWPDYIYVQKELPRTSVGKVDFMKLKAENEDLLKKHEQIGKLTVIIDKEEIIKKRKLR